VTQEGAIHNDERQVSTCLFLIMSSFLLSYLQNSAKPSPRRRPGSRNPWKIWFPASAGMTKRDFCKWHYCFAVIPLRH